jgi:2-polyprenyl-6-methoxyphenol hydroxylase-like FAD-dependent oxidoreductase
VTAIEQVAAERWGRGAVALVGDAAHRMSPNMAQGAALAFEDALVLAAELRDAATVTDALAGFVARRSRRAGWVRAQTTAATTPATSRRSCATSSCRPSDGGSSTPTPAPAGAHLADLIR